MQLNTGSNSLHNTGSSQHGNNIGKYSMVTLANINNDNTVHTRLVECDGPRSAQCRAIVTWPGSHAVAREQSKLVKR